MEQSIIYTDDELQLAMNNMVRALDYFFDDTIEVRIPKTKHDGVVSGYFNDPDEFMDCAFTYFGKSNVYITVNQLDTSQIQVKVDNKLHAVTKKHATTSDNQIKHRKWFLLDFDPVRSNGDTKCSSTDEEWQCALNSARECREWLSEHGWPEPILASSGNGGHLVYRIDLPNTRENTVLIERCLDALKQRYDTETVMFDTSVSNPSRIWKLYGTMAVKGPNTDERPHRLATILDAPEPNEIEIVPVEKLSELADLAPKTTAQQSGLRKIKSIIAGERSRGFGTFDSRQWLETWIDNSDLDVASVQAWNDGTMWVLTSCPYEAYFNETDHLDPNKAYITLTDDGIGAGCQSSNCQALYDERGAWQTLRDIVEPGWEERREEKRQKVVAKKQAGRPKKDVTVSLLEQYEIEACTDLGNARRLVHRYGADIRYTGTMEWLLWDGTRWNVDASGGIHLLAEETVRDIPQEVAQVADETAQKALSYLLRDHAVASQHDARLNAMVKRARHQREVVIEHTALDNQPWLLNVENGTINLQSGVLEPHRREDYLTKVIPIRYNPEAMCPNWLHFLTDIMCGNIDMVAFLQRSVGYTLTGLTTEQCLFILYGTGANGKSAFLTVLKHLLGAYAKTAEFKTFTETKNDTIRNDLARLMGARLVAGSEGDAGQYLSESVVKSLTGGDVIAARFLRKEFFEFGYCARELWKRL